MGSLEVEVTPDPKKSDIQELSQCIVYIPMKDRKKIRGFSPGMFSSGRDLIWVLKTREWSSQLKLLFPSSACCGE